MKKEVKKVTFGGLCLAMALLLPQVFHLFGLQQAGAIFLPMHLPIFIGGLLLGPVYGAVIGVLAPLVSTMLTGMPSSERVFFMVIELATYGMISGSIFQVFNRKEKRMGVITALLIAMLAGRIMYGIALTFATYILQILVGGFAVVFTATTIGIPGIIMQIIIVPMIVILLNKTPYFKEVKL